MNNYIRLPGNAKTVVGFVRGVDVLNSKRQVGLHFTESFRLRRGVDAYGVAYLWFLAFLVDDDDSHIGNLIGGTGGTAG